MSSLHGADGLTTDASRPPRLLEQARERMRRLGLARRTEEAYLGWMRRFVLASGRRHPRELGKADVEALLTHLAVHGGVAVATQNQALSALLFLYREVLQKPLPWLDEIVRAKKPQRLPTVLDREEVRRLLDAMSGASWRELAGGVSVLSRRTAPA